MPTLVKLQVELKPRDTTIETSMFKCQKCGATEFKLMLRPGFDGQVDIGTNENQEVVIKVNGKEFVADLMFMNQFAVCSDCEAIGAWAYHFPKETSATEEL
jgi:hypothetical protein